MAQKRNSKTKLPNLSLAEAHRKADQYSLSDLHHQTNAAAKQAILHELHSSMQLRAERIRLHQKGSSDTRYDGDERLRGGAAGREPMTRAPFGYQTKHVTFHEAHLEPRAQSRIPIPVHPDPSQRLRGHQVNGVQGQAGRGRTRPNVRRGGDGDGRHGEKAVPVTYEYTWGQRGRLNELRIRFLARKYFKLWRSNACTGIRPSVIREHYNSRLLRKMFDEWREFWWTQRREWTLMIRAEYHHRYKIYQHVWMSWRNFVVREKVKNAKKEISTTHASNLLLNKALTAWKQYVTQRRAKAILKQRAKKFHQARALQLCWNEWKAAMYQRREEGEAEVFALQYWAESVTQRAWNAWKRRWTERQEMKKNERLAEHHHEKKLVSRCYYQGFLTYTHHRKKKKRINAQACEVYSDRLLTHAWQHWNQRWFTRRSLAQRQEQVDHLGNRSRMRRVLTHWRFYIHLVHVDRSKEYIARTHHNTQLKKLGVLMLRLAVAQRKVKGRRTEQAIELHQQMLVKRCWNQWILQCEHREELRLFSATRKARKMHRKRLLNSVVHQWCNYTVWRRHRKEQYARADDYYARRNLLPKCIQRLRHNAELEKRKSALQAQAAEFYREGQLGRCFYRWCHSFQLSQDIRMMERMAFLHHESILSKRFFTEWRERTRSKLKESEKMYRAMDHHHLSLCTKALSRWIEFTGEARQRSEFERIAAQHDYRQRARRTWDKWREYVSHRRCKAVKKSRADLYHHRKQMRKVFTAWKQHCQQMHGVYKVVAVKESAVNLRRLKHAFSDWRVCVETANEERSLERIAVHHRNTMILSKVYYKSLAHQCSAACC
ncbi:protein SFI1 homolog [Strongylocentrotus purpuratus]|uniref:Sfi1 spindle body domain-containing protein n=1 Tax=Strongylocentrotus purpuratus TaxID=7668 RepID=A0A7M7PDB5_STRPU|nr:protein SFI1 homolog [Strongylocentrotus purpuratus]